MGRSWREEGRRLRQWAPAGLLLVLGLLAGVLQATGQTRPGPLRLGDLEIPGYVGYVNDFAGVLQGDQRRTLEAFLGSLDRKTGAQFTLVTLPGLEGNDRDDVAVRLFETWGIGRKDDRGLLLLDAVKEREMKVEVGYGLEGILPDGLVGRLRDEYFTKPLRGRRRLRSEDRYRAYSGMLLAMAEIVARDRGLTLDEIVQGSRVARRPVRRQRRGGWIGLLALLFIFLVIFRRSPLLGILLLMGMTGGGGGGHRGGGFGGFGGGFGGFGGGMSGGGGAGGRY